MLTPNSIRLYIPALAAALALAPPAFASDISLKLDAGTGFSIQDSTGVIERLRVDEATGNVSRNGALFVHTTGTSNLFVGAGAGNPATTGSGGNTAVGYRALYSNTTGFSNSAFGDRALLANTTGYHNVAVGQYAGQNQTTGSDNIYLANTGVAEESGRIRIGTDLTHTATFIAGINGANVGGTALPVFVNTSGQLGTGGGSQAPWTADVDAAGNAINDLGSLTFQQIVPGQGTSIQIPNTTGSGLSFAASESGFDWSGATRLTAASLGINVNSSGSNMGNFFNPNLHTRYEVNYDTPGWPNDTSSEYHIIVLTGRSTSTVANAGSGVGQFLADNLVSVEDAVTTQVVGIGWIEAIGTGANAAISIDWGYSADPTGNPPSNGDTIEGPSATTVTNSTGTFGVAHERGAWVYPSATCGADETGSTARIAFVTVSGNDVTFIRVEGPEDDVIEGNCIRQAGQYAPGPTALLGPITTAKSTTFASALSSGQQDFRPFSSVFTHHGMKGEMSWYSNKAVFGPVPTLRIGSLGGADTHWINLVSSVAYDPGGGMIGLIGSPNDPQNFGIVGKWKFFESGDSDWGHRIEVGAPTTVSDVRNQLLADASGTIPALDLTGCDPGDPIVASDGVGGVECGTPIGGGSAAITGASAAADVPFRKDTSTDAVADGDLNFQSRLPTLGTSAARHGRSDFMEDSDGGSNEVTLSTAAAATHPTGEFTLPLAKLSKAVASGGGRGPVVGAVSNGGTFDTPEELCDSSYGAAEGVTPACVSGSAKKFGTSTPADQVHLIGCGDTVGPGVYFEVVCTVAQRPLQ